MKNSLMSKFEFVEQENFGGIQISVEMIHGMI